MPPHKKVSSLKSITRDRVMYTICAVVLDEILTTQEQDWEAFGPPRLPVRLQIVKEILINGVGPKVMEDILNIILHSDGDVEPTVRYLVLQLLLVKGTRTLLVGHFPESYYSYVLEAIAESAAHIKSLDLRGVWVRMQDQLQLYRVLRRLEDVRHLVLRYVCDDQILHTIGKHCHSLERLDISGSSGITEDGILSLVKNSTRSKQSFTCNICTSLEIVDIGGPGAFKLPNSMAQTLLLELPNLKSLGSYERTGIAIQTVTESKPNIKFRLQYIHDVGTRSGAMLAIAKSCPDIKAIYLDTPGSIAVHHLHMLPNLTELKLHKIKWPDVLQVLEKCGDRIRSLTLLSVFGNLNLLELGSLCPDMIRLELHSVHLLCYDMVHATALKNVREMLIYNSEISNNCIKMILNQSAKVEHLSLGECGLLTDAAVQCCLMDHSLQNLKIIWFGLAESLTMRTVTALLEHCPLLTEIGNLASWDIPREELFLLRAQIEATNVDLTIHDCGPDEEQGVLVFIF